MTLRLYKLNYKLKTIGALFLLAVIIGVTGGTRHVNAVVEQPGGTERFIMIEKTWIDESSDEERQLPEIKVAIKYNTDDEPYIVTISNNIDDYTCETINNEEITGLYCFTFQDDYAIELYRDGGNVWLYGIGIMQSAVSVEAWETSEVDGYTSSNLESNPAIAENNTVKLINTAKQEDSSESIEDNIKEDIPVSTNSELSENTEKTITPPNTGSNSIVTIIPALGTSLVGIATTSLMLSRRK